LAGGFAQTPLAGPDVRERKTAVRYKKFFTRQAGFEAPAKEAWSRLAKVYIIRNALAHSGTYVIFEPEERKEQLKRAIESFRGIALDRVLLEVDTAFCEDIIDLVCSFCGYLLAQLTRAREAFLLRNPGH
jgi:hypothetical protein